MGAPAVSREALNDRSVLFVENIQAGMSQTAAARAAGYADPEKHAKRLLANPQIKRVLQLMSKFQTGKHKVTRDQVTSMVLEAFETAKIQADAGSMVRAASELSRMNGFYEPETRKIDLNIKVTQQKEVIQQMSDEELLEMVGGDIIEGEYEQADAN